MVDFLAILILSMACQILASKIFFFKLPENNVTGDENNYRHLNNERIVKICDSRDVICSSNDTVVCTVRFVKDNVDYKNYNNSCYLFLSNMCEFPGQEYHIIDGNTCEHYLKTNKPIRRRSNDAAFNVTSKTTQADNNNKSTSKSVNLTMTLLNNDNVTVIPTSINLTVIPMNINVTKTSTSYSVTSRKFTSGSNKPIGRAGKTTTTMAPRYDLDTSFDDHHCPYSCPDDYNPICVIVNRGEGKYFKYFTFVNHCFGDMYYCKYFDLFKPPPDMEYEDVKSSPLSWSYCAAYRYLQFARFAEVASAMGHFGWLAGDHRYSHIMEPHQRMPGYGK